MNNAKNTEDIAQKVKKVSPEGDIFDRSRYFNVPIALLADSMRDKWWRAVWVWLLMKDMGDGFCESPVEELSTLTGWKPSTVNTWLKVACKKGLLARCPRNRDKWYVVSVDTVARKGDKHWKRVRYFTDTKDFKHWAFSVLVASIYKSNQWITARIVRKRLWRKGKQSNPHWGGIACQLIEDLFGIPKVTAWRMRKRCELLGYLQVTPRLEEIPLENMTRWDWRILKRFCEIQDGRIFRRLAYSVIPQGIEFKVKWNNSLLEK